MRRITVHSEREHRIMLEHPDFVLRVARPIIGEALHGLPSRQVRYAPQMTDDGFTVDD
jgi:hypothetical protein